MTETPIKDMPGLKHRELEPCAFCGQGVLHDNNLVFYRVAVEYFITNTRAIQRAVGLEMMMDGNAVLANVMGPNADLAKQVGERRVLVCMPCAMSESAMPGRIIEGGDDD